MGLGEIVGPLLHDLGAGCEQVAALVGALDAFDDMREAGLCDLARHCGVGAPAQLPPPSAAMLSPARFLGPHGWRVCVDMIFIG